MNFNWCRVGAVLALAGLTAACVNSNDKGYTYEASLPIDGKIIFSK